MSGGITTMTRLNTANPTTKEEFKSLVETLAVSHADLRERTLLYVLRTLGATGSANASASSANSSAVASMVTDGKFGTLHAIYETLACPDFSREGFFVRTLTTDDTKQLYALFAPFHAEAEAHPNVTLLKTALETNQAVECTILNKETADSTRKERYLQFKTTLLFELFNEGFLRGSDGLARQALLDAFGTLPNRFLTPDGHFLLSTNDEPQFARTVPGYSVIDEHQGGTARADLGGIDKFPSLLHVHGERLKADGNRIIPSAMIRDGVHIGKRNIFMFHAAVNIAAFIGDDNLIDSHASIASAAQLGNKNKIGSFVSLEGVLSPANAVPVYIGDENFVGSFARIGTGITIGNKNFIASGVNLSLGTKIRDCREGSSTHGDYVTPRELNEDFNSLAIVPNNAIREFNKVPLVPGEYAVFANTEDFMKRFEGDTRIKGR